ncbi:AraC family transcriptional regulator [Wenxinia marina]|uniref:Transcriptional regulator, AraC family n=1 Tax=Wenxinia marina DSM 24838 TaxID=1123501 RepID=A0A0D0PCN5_9RHOB|nr:AraC family transcriptional regulator [Wenxinia marina]KIQ69156.1 transcriptional regulator, AraC family [Wenxinia marina DSM 24838]GGL70791.1 AraC family transcriptional regulator [Wenxinia marina]
MGTVPATFARTFAAVAGLALDASGELADGARVLLRVPPGERLDEAHYHALIEAVVAHHGDRAGLAIGYAEALHLDDLGALGLAVKTAPRLRDSLQRVERYYRLVTDSVRYRLDETAAPLFLLDRDGPTREDEEVRDECALAGFARNMRRFVGPELRLEEVTFAHPCRLDAGRLAEWFGCPVRFDAPRTSIAFAPDVLDLPTRLGDPAVSRFLTAHLDAQLAALAPGDPLERALAAHLSEALSTGVPRAGAVARALGMSERTLYRRLSDLGLTYQGVLERTQRSLAESLLAEGHHSLAEVAFLTGFSEQSSFSRAFKRWVGRPPGRFRRAAPIA